jgi:caffeoyl-CoA O-methyltransferase
MADYVLLRFQPEDDLLASVRARAAAAGLPAIHVSAFDGRLLEVIARSVAPRLVVEIGTLAGYSAVCLARGMAPDGRLHTLEIDPRHADVARETFVDAGLAHRIELHLGSALPTLSSFDAESVDLVFIDADKESYPDYVRWAAGALRMGGLLLADNSFGFGLVPDGPFRDEPEERSIRAIDRANQMLADPVGSFRSMMIPTSEGLAMAVKVR